jgi:hypothetical protein
MRRKGEEQRSEFLQDTRSKHWPQVRAKVKKSTSLPTLVVWYGQLSYMVVMLQMAVSSPWHADHFRAGGYMSIQAGPRFEPDVQSS